MFLRPTTERAKHGQKKCPPGGAIGYMARNCRVNIWSNLPFWVNIWSKVSMFCFCCLKNHLLSARQMRLRKKMPKNVTWFTWIHPKVAWRSCPIMLQCVTWLDQILAKPWTRSGLIFGGILGSDFVVQFFCWTLASYSSFSKIAILKSTPPPPKCWDTICEHSCTIFNALISKTFCFLVHFWFLFFCYVRFWGNVSCQTRTPPLPSPPQKKVKRWTTKNKTISKQARHLLFSFDKKTTRKTFRHQEARSQKPLQNSKNQNRTKHNIWSNITPKTLKLQGSRCFGSQAESKTRNTIQTTK